MTHIIERRYYIFLITGFVRQKQKNLPCSYYEIKKIPDGDLWRKLPLDCSEDFEFYNSPHTAPESNQPIQNSNLIEGKSIPV